MTDQSEFNSPIRRYLIPVTGPLLARRITQLIVGLTIFGIGIVLMLQSRLGLPPWDVLHQGLAEHHPVDSLEPQGALHVVRRQHREGDQ